MELAVVGDDDFVTGFMLSGVRHAFETNGNVNEVINKVIQNKEIGIVIMDEKEYSSLNAKMKEFLENTIRPVVVTLSKEGRGEDLRLYIKRTLGVDLWQKEKSTE